MQQKFWNLIAKYSVILGAILGLSTILESTMSFSGDYTIYMLLIVEWIAVFVLHLYLLHWFTKRYSKSFSIEEGFGFGMGYRFVLYISAFAGIILGLVNYIHIYTIVGYHNSISKLIVAAESMLTQYKEILSHTMEEPAIDWLINYMMLLENQPEPSILSVVWAGMLGGIIFGAIYGLIIAGINYRAAKPFNTTVE